MTFQNTEEMSSFLNGLDRGKLAILLGGKHYNPTSYQTRKPLTGGLRFIVTMKTFLQVENIFPMCS